MSTTPLWLGGGVASLQRDALDVMSGATISLGVSCAFEYESDLRVALVDTGASWSMIGGALARRLDAGDSVGELTMSTRFGRFTGHLQRVPVILLSEAGSPLVVSATLLLCPEWPGPPILGFSGCLERIRFAFVPDATGVTTWFHFAAVER